VDIYCPFDGRAEELVTPYYIFKEAGAHVVVASLKGGKIPIGKLLLVLIADLIILFGSIISLILVILDAMII